MTCRRARPPRPNELRQFNGFATTSRKCHLGAARSEIEGVMRGARPGRPRGAGGGQSSPIVPRAPTAPLALPAKVGRPWLYQHSNGIAHTFRTCSSHGGRPLSVTALSPFPTMPAHYSMRRHMHTSHSSKYIIRGLVDTLRLIAPKQARMYKHYDLAEHFAKLSLAQADYTIDAAALKSEKKREAGESGGIPTTATGEQLGYGQTAWHTAVHLQPTFSTCASIAFLHAWLLTTRIRAIDLPAEEIKPLMSGLPDHLFFNLEAAMDQKHGITSSAVRQRYLRDYFEVWRGAVLAYDEGIYKGDPVLAAALWRNVLKAQEDVSPIALLDMVWYVRAAFWELDRMEDEEFMEEGQVEKMLKRVTDMVFGDETGGRALRQVMDPDYLKKMYEPGVNDALDKDCIVIEGEGAAGVQATTRIMRPATKPKPPPAPMRGARNIKPTPVQVPGTKQVKMPQRP